jgi:Sugar-tranasporters, 12 TM
VRLVWLSFCNNDPSFYGYPLSLKSFLAFFKQIQVRIMPNFSILFWASLVLCAGVTFRSSDFYKRSQTGTNNSRSASDQEGLSKEVKEIHAKLLKKYLFVYLMAALSDWLQGPYVYALYSEYGFNQHQIAQLFVAGFGSSMIFGSFVGSIADWGGRRFFVIIFAVVYAASCMTKRK